MWRAGPLELAWHYAIRHQVFVEEQGVLVLTDLDRWDSHPEVQHVVAAYGQTLVGVVRLYPLDDEGRWKGDRLAVLPPQRATMVGAHLVRFAVAQAAAAGGREMEAYIQPANVRFFEWLGWSRNGEVRPYLGIDHQPMLISLDDPAPCRHTPRPATPHFEQRDHLVGIQAG